MANPIISVLSPSIRPEGLAITFLTLQQQTMPRENWEWLPRLSIPGAGTLDVPAKPDLCYQMNQALKEAKGEIIVFLQDWIHIPPTALQDIAALHYQDKGVAWTMPVGKTVNKDGSGYVKWDWRGHGLQEDAVIAFTEWEIDWAFVSRETLENAGGFDEEFDSGFGWENVELAKRMHRLGCRFRVNKIIRAVAWDHDQFEPHPFRANGNAALWNRKNTD